MHEIEVIMKYQLLSVFVFFLSTLQAQTLDGGFSSLGREEATATVQLTAIGGQPFCSVIGSERLSYGLTEQIVLASEASEVASLSLDRTTASIKIGNNLQLTASILPENAPNQTVKWYSSNPTVATVCDGLVQALDTGTAMIVTVSASGLFADTCTIVVSNTSNPEPVPVSGIKLDRTVATLQNGEILLLAATVFPMDADNKQVEWTSSDERVATVDKGMVVAKSEGSAMIRVVTIDGGYQAECQVTVQTESTAIDPIETGDKVYPIVVRRELFVDLQQSQTVYLINMAGQVCVTLQGNIGSNVIRMEPYPAGIYFVRLSGQTVKIIKR